MKKIFYLIALTLAVTSTGSCDSHSAVQRAETDSLRRADSLARIADSLTVAAERKRVDDSVTRNFTSPDLTLFDTHGRIQSIVYHTSCEWIGSPHRGELLFDTLGRLTAPEAVHDGGKIVEMEGRSYGWQGNNVKMMGSAAFGNKTDEYERFDRSYLLHHYHPATGQLLESEVIDKKAEMKIIYTYTITDTDRHGNWLSREVTRRELLLPSREEVGREVIGEVRSISYFAVAAGDTSTVE